MLSNESSLQHLVTYSVQQRSQEEQCVEAGNVSFDYNTTKQAGGKVEVS